MEADLARFAEEPSVRRVLLEGIDLMNYGDHIESQLQEFESKSLDDYLNQVPRVKQLHQDIESCSSALHEMQSLLQQFDDSLGLISSQIYALQSRSQTITLHLQNRNELESRLGKYTHDICITREFAEHISQDPISQSYVKLVEELFQKIKFCQQPGIAETKSAQEMNESLGRLRMKACGNIQKYFLNRINQLRDHYSTLQYDIQTDLLQLKFLYHFLKESSTGSDIRSYYIEVASNIYLEIFSNFTKRIINQMAQISTSPETIVPSVSNKRSLFGFLNKRSSASGESNLFFSIGDRYKLLRDPLEQPPPFGDGKYPVESMIKSLYLSLIEDVTNENGFASTFFQDDNITTSIFSLTTRHLQNFLTTLLSKITDPICIALLLRFSIAHKKEMERRKIFKIDQHLSWIIQAETDRFREIINSNIEAIIGCDPTFIQDNPITAHHANAMTRRYSEFLASMTRIFNDDISVILHGEVESVGFAVVQLLEKSAKTFTNDEMSFTFLINNYNLIFQVDSPTKGLIEAKLKEVKQKYAEIIAARKFPLLADGMISINENVFE